MATLNQMEQGIQVALQVLMLPFFICIVVLLINVLSFINFCVELYKTVTVWHGRGHCCDITDFIRFGAALPGNGWCSICDSGKMVELYKILGYKLSP